MINVSAELKADHLLFECSGHADYAEYGKDIVCAGVSSLCMALEAIVSVLLECGYQFSIKRKTVKKGFLLFEIDLDPYSLDAHTVPVAFETVLCGMKAIEKHHPENITVKIKT